MAYLYRRIITMKDLILKIHRKPFKWYHIFIFPLIITYVLMNYVPLPLEILLMLVFYFPISLGDGDYWRFFMMYFIFIAIWAVFIAYCAIFKKSRPVLKAIWTKVRGNTIPMFLLGLFIGGGLNALNALAAALNGDIFLYFEPSSVWKVVLLFFAVVIQSGAEELVCRGFLYQKLIRGYNNPAIAIIGNSVLFSLLHIANPGITPVALVSIALSGIMFSLMVYYFDSIWCAIGAHTAWNYMQNIILGLPNSGMVSSCSIFKLDAASARNSFVYNVGFGVEGSGLSLVLLAVTSVLIFLWGKKKGKRPTDVWEDQIRQELLEIEQRQAMLAAQKGQIQ